MNITPLEPRSWSRGRWWLLVALVFAAHIGLIFAFGDRKPVVPRQPPPAPALHVVNGPIELLALNDPTLFALPHARCVSGAAGLQIPSAEFRPTRWTEPLRWLELSVDQLGSAFTLFAQTNNLASFEFEAKPAPELTVPAPLLPEKTMVPGSMLRLAGDLEHRGLLSVFQLPPRPSVDLLTNSVVQVLVDAAGDVVSAALLPPGDGSKETDQWKADTYALELAKAARFEPLRAGAAKLSLGEMVFEWQTVPMTSAESPLPP